MKPLPKRRTDKPLLTVWVISDCGLIGQVIQSATQASGPQRAPSAISRFSNYANVNDCFLEYHQIPVKEVNDRSPLCDQDLSSDIGLKNPALRLFRVKQSMTAISTSLPTFT